MVNFYSVGFTNLFGLRRLMFHVTVLFLPFEAVILALSVLQDEQDQISL